MADLIQSLYAPSARAMCFRFAQVNPDLGFGTLSLVIKFRRKKTAEISAVFSNVAER